MENSKLPMQTCMLAIMFVSATKKGFSCLEFQRQLGLSRYEKVYKLMHKIRSVMSIRDSLYLLKDMVAYNEGFIEVATKKQIKSQLKPGKGSQRQELVGISAESIPLKTPNLVKEVGFVVF